MKGTKEEKAGRKKKREGLELEHPALPESANTNTLIKKLSISGEVSG